jgi:4-amino-4-deoxy-L-arabinose transferase-like glycosyltransferase
MTNLLDSLLALLVATIANLAVVYQIQTRAPRSETRFLLRIYVWAILLRYTLAIAINVLAADSSFASTFWGDSGSYDVGGSQLALRWKGEPVASVYMLSAISGYGWIYFVGLIYYIFGQNQLLVQFLNGLMSGLTVVIIYLITSRLFDAAAARWAALFMAFFPQMVFWSAGMYKDPAILLCIALSMYAVLRLRERFSIGNVGLFVVSVVLLVTLRFYIAYFVAFAALATFLFAQKQGIVRLVMTYVFLGVVLLGVLNLAVRRETLERQTSYMTLERLQTTREDQAMWGRSGFGQEYDVSTPAGALAAFPLGLVYLLFSPFPWAVSGLRQALAVPETLVWYALMPAFVRGLLHSLRHRARDILPILVFAVSLTGAYALMQGNVGTAYRQRTQISMFFFVFMGVGLSERERRRAGVTSGAIRAAAERES